MTDRITGGFLLVLALAFGLHARTFKTTFITDPLGPQSWPVMLAVLLGLLSLYLIARPDPKPDWPPRVVLGRQVLMVATLVGYAVVLEVLGFLLATVLVVWVLALLLGSGWWKGALTGMASSVVLYLLFNSALGLPLPVGAIFGG